MRKILSVVLVLCFVFGMSSESLAAKRKSSKNRASSGDAITQILRKHKPENNTNAQTIRDILKKYNQSHIFVITLTDDNWLIIECVSAKNGASKGKATLGLGDKYIDNPVPVWNKMKNACIFEYSGLALHFYKARIKSETDFELVRNDELYGVEELDKLLDRSGLFVEDKFPFVLKYLETGI